MVDKAELAVEAERRLAKYVPERDYKSRDHEPYDGPWPDLCGHCVHYYDKIHSLGSTEKAFPPKCDGHIGGLTKGLLENDFDNAQEFMDVLILSDPVAWAAATFPDDLGDGWMARWYQEEIMSCTARKKVIRAGRRCGKTEAICVMMLWMTHVNADFSVLVIAPFEAQVNLIWDKIESFINKAPSVSSTIRRSTKSPEHRLEFNNGSKIIGFSSGPTSSARSDKVRGQDAKYIVLDEADYLASDDIEAILAILASHPDCGMWASSTPKGTHDKFYQFCVQKDIGFKEFHYVSAESPSWGEDAEKFFRTTYDAVTYEHEFEAEFGIQEAGVFRNDLIDSSLMDYDLPRARAGPGTRTIIGVDWNGQDIGTHVVVVEACNTDRGLKYILLEKIVIKGVEFTQHASIQRILELDTKYNADYIYVDHGYGEVQVEMLHMLGRQDPGTGLRKRVKPYAMGGKIEIKDPLTGKMIKKAAKPFMVNNTARALEQYMLILPYSEDTQILVESRDGKESQANSGIVQQMRNFAVERVSVTGQPTYSQGEDHTLTAFMLAITGFMLEFSDMKRGGASAEFYNIEKRNEDGSRADPDKKLEELASLARQLDLGKSQFPRIAQGIQSTKEIQREVEYVKRGISKGDNKTLRSYFGIGGSRSSLGNTRRKMF